MSATPTCQFEEKKAAGDERSIVVPGENAPRLSGAREWNLAYRLDSALRKDEDARLRRLLAACFATNPFFWFRRFYLERPAHRWLVRNAAGQFIGHAAVHEKTVGTKFGDLRIGGVAEVCVAANYRGLGILKGMLQTVHEWMAAQGIPFSMLFGQPRIYVSSGYIPMKNELRASNSFLRIWVPGRGNPMIKPLAETAWPEGRIDLRGPTF